MTIVNVATLHTMKKEMNNGDSKVFVPNAGKQSVKNSFSNVKPPIQKGSCILKEQLNAKLNTNYQREFSSEICQYSN